MRLTTKVDGDLRRLMDAEVRIGKMAALGAVAGVAAAIKEDWRGQIRSAGLGDRLTKSVQFEAYPKSGGSLNAAGLVWSKAKKIVGAFETGVEIRARGGKWLAIPLPAAGTGRGNGRFTPGEWERRRGVKLRFVYRPNGKALLVADGRLNKKGFGVESRSKTGRGRATVPIFLLVPRVRLQKRLNLQSSADRIARTMGARLVSGWRD